MKSPALCVGIGRHERSAAPRVFSLLWLREKTVTPWKFNIAPENIPSQKESSLPTIIFHGLC